MIANINANSPFGLRHSPFVRPIHTWRQIYWGGGADDDDDDDDHDHDNFGDYVDHDDDYDDAEEKDTCKFEERNGADDDLWEAGATYSETDLEWWDAEPKSILCLQHQKLLNGWNILLCHRE